MSLGSVSHAVLDQGPSAVLIVHAEEVDPQLSTSADRSSAA
jgi:hypothetical protein